MAVSIGTSSYSLPKQRTSATTVVSYSVKSEPGTPRSCASPSDLREQRSVQRRPTFTEPETKYSEREEKYSEREEKYSEPETKYSEREAKYSEQLNGGADLREKKNSESSACQSAACKSPEISTSHLRRNTRDPDDRYLVALRASINKDKAETRTDGNSKTSDCPSKSRSSFWQRFANFFSRKKECGQALVPDPCVKENVERRKQECACDPEKCETEEERLREERREERRQEQQEEVGSQPQPLTPTCDVARTSDSQLGDQKGARCGRDRSEREGDKSAQDRQAAWLQRQSLKALRGKKSSEYRPGKVKEETIYVERSKPRNPRPAGCKSCSPEAHKKEPSSERNTCNGRRRKQNRPTARPPVPPPLPPTSSRRVPPAPPPPSSASNRRVPPAPRPPSPASNRRVPPAPRPPSPASNSRVPPAPRPPSPASKRRAPSAQRPPLSGSNRPPTPPTPRPPAPPLCRICSGSSNSLPPATPPLSRLCSRSSNGLPPATPPPLSRLCSRSSNDQPPATPPPLSPAPSSTSSPPPLLPDDTPSPIPLPPPPVISLGTDFPPCPPPLPRPALPVIFAIPPTPRPSVSCLCCSSARTPSQRSVNSVPVPPPTPPSPDAESGYVRMWSSGSSDGRNSYCAQPSTPLNSSTTAIQTPPSGVQKQNGYTNYCTDSECVIHGGGSSGYEGSDELQVNSYSRDRAATTTPYSSPDAGPCLICSSYIRLPSEVDPRTQQPPIRRKKVIILDHGHLY